MIGIRAMWSPIWCRNVTLLLLLLLFLIYRRFRNQDGGWGALEEDSSEF